MEILTIPKVVEHCYNRSSVQLLRSMVGGEVWFISVASKSGCWDSASSVLCELVWAYRIKAQLTKIGHRADNHWLVNKLNIDWEWVWRSKTRNDKAEFPRALLIFSLEICSAEYQVRRMWLVRSICPLRKPEARHLLVKLEQSDWGPVVTIIHQTTHSRFSVHMIWSIFH